MPLAPIVGALNHVLARYQTTIARTGKIPAITWSTPNKVDKLGVIALSHAECCSSDAMIRANSARCSFSSVSPRRGSAGGAHGSVVRDVGRRTVSLRHGRKRLHLMGRSEALAQHQGSYRFFSRQP